MKRTIAFVLLLMISLTVASPVFAGTDDIRVPFLLYHSVPDTLNEDDDILLHISKDMFYEHMVALKNAGYNSITLDEYYNYVENNGTLPENPIVICFDDGYENNYTNAWPILKELDMKATIFVIVSRVGDHTVKYPHFTWQEAIEMEESGVIDIESHSYTHPSFSTLTYGETVREMRLSKYILEKNMNKVCNYMAYPYGHTSAFSDDVGKKAGYKLMCLVENSGANGKDTVLTDIHRLNVSATMDAEYLLWYVESNK